jgi:hypothetical protein
MLALTSLMKAAGREPTAKASVSKEPPRVIRFCGIDSAFQIQGIQSAHYNADSRTSRCKFSAPPASLGRSYGSAQTVTPVSLQRKNLRFETRGTGRLVVGDSAPGPDPSVIFRIDRRPIHDLIEPAGYNGTCRTVRQPAVHVDCCFLTRYFYCTPVSMEQRSLR